MLISVFTPTYNRAELIHRVFDSLSAQSFVDFEWIVVDDGSSDDTLDILEEFRSKATFPITIVSRENRGKVRSINEGLQLAKGELFICFDSDDWCISNAFQRIAEVWSNLSDIEKDTCSGISCLKSFNDGSIVGEDYSRMAYRGETYVDRFNRRIRGDKWEIIRTIVHRCYLYDIKEGERYLAPEYSWLKIGRRFDTIFLNEPLSIVEYQPDGISQNNLHHRVNNPRSAAHFYILAWQVSVGFLNTAKAAINHTRFSFHSRTSNQLPGVARYLALVPGFTYYLHDLFDLRKRRK